MSLVKVESIGKVEPNSFNGLTKTTFLSEGRVIYIFTKAGNEPSEGDQLDGDVAQDKAGNLKFTKTKNESYGGPQRTAQPKSEIYKKRDDTHIKAQWAIGQAVSIVSQNLKPDEELPFDGIEDIAKELFAMVDRVKDSDAPAEQTQIPVADSAVKVDWDNL